MQTTDVIIIGAGPVGLFAIFECGMMKMRCHVIDTLDAVGGQCAALYPEKPIYDIPGFPSIQAEDLIRQLKEQARPFYPTYHLGQQVLGLNPHEGGWLVTTSTGAQIHGKAVIIAAGVGAFGPNRPPLENIEAFEEKSIHYFITNREQYRGKKLVIAGGGDSALDWALSLSQIAEKIYFVHRRPKFRGAPETVDQLMALANDLDSCLELVVPYQLAGLGGENGVLKEVLLEDLDGGKRTLEADYLLPFFGLSMNLGPILNWGLQLDRDLLVVEPTTQATNLPGIFAIGDICTYPHKLKLILCGFSEAAQAAHQARSIVHPGESFHFEHSTTSGVPRLS